MRQRRVTVSSDLLGGGSLRAGVSSDLLGERRMPEPTARAGERQVSRLTGEIVKTCGWDLAPPRLCWPAIGGRQGSCRRLARDALLCALAVL